MKAPEGAGYILRRRQLNGQEPVDPPLPVACRILCRMAAWARGCRADDVLGAALLFALVPALLCLGGW